MTQQEETAVHEAGHVVLAWRYGVRVKSATIQPDRENFGVVKYYIALRDMEKTTAARLMLGGPEAVRHFRAFCPGGRVEGSEHDYDQVRQLLTTPTRPAYGTKMEVVIEDLEALTAADVRSYARDIRAVADALLKQTTIRWFDLERILGPEGTP